MSWSEDYNLLLTDWQWSLPLLYNTHRHPRYVYVLTIYHRLITAEKISHSQVNITDLSFSDCRSAILCFSSSSSRSASFNLILSTSSCVSFTVRVSCRSDSFDRKSRQICSLVDSWWPCASSFRCKLFTSANTKYASAKIHSVYMWIGKSLYHISSQKPEQQVPQALCHFTDDII